MVARLPLALALGLLLAFVPPTFANHPQVAHGDVIVFDHKTGNEWWVEVVLSGGASGSASAVQAMDTGGPWVSLTKQSWGAWAASFHIEPGHQVKFRALWAGGAMADSCWFDHPSGVERCSPSSTSPSATSSSTTTGGGFDASFSNVKGNTWWIEAKVTANQPLAGVDARVDCTGSWRPLALKDWGAWAASFNIPSGSKVDLRARSTTGGTDLSGGYLWTAATPTSACSGSTTTTTTTPPPPPAFDATFTGVKGNNWWIQATVSGNQPISRVEARIDCETDAWFALTKHSWGGWATSIHVLEGQRVDFRATGSSGATDVSEGYTWVAATPAPACPATWPPPPSGFHAAYSNLRGDGGHVEADVTASQPLAAVAARTMNSLAWHPLTKGAGSTWAGDFDVTGHNVVEFRATATDGSRHVTHQGWYWPYPGSYTTEPVLYPSPGTNDDVYFAAIRGDEEQVWVDTYSIYPLSAVHLQVDPGPTWFPMVMDAASGDWMADGLSIPYGSRIWLRATYTLATGATGTVTEPGGEGPWPTWPQMGSYYSYREKGNSSGTDDETGVHYTSTSDTFIHVMTEDGRYSNWKGTCTTITRSFVTPPGQPGHWENRTDTYDFDREPQGGWADAPVGTKSEVRWPSTCAQMVEPDMPVCERGPHRTSLRTISGDPITLDAVRGCRDTPSGAPPPESHEEFWWDQRVGLLLDWNTSIGPNPGFSDWRSESYGWLVDTDAPLAAP